MFSSKLLHYFMLLKHQQVLVQVVPNLCKQHGSIELFLHVVIVIPWADIVDIRHCRWHGLKVNDLLLVLCGIIFFLFIRIIADVILTCQ